MSTSQANTVKPARKSTRAPKHTGQNSRAAMSENEAYSTNPAVQHMSPGEAKHKQRRKSQANKKFGGNSDAAVHSDGPIHRNSVQPEKTRATPVKQQAYAGPTFHQSPAASALPIPAFWSKSLPNASMGTTSANEASVPGGTQEKGVEPNHAPLINEPKRETTPLDFLFDAARKAQVTPGSESPHRRYLTPGVGSPSSRSPAGREAETQFPFEFDMAERDPTQDDRAFSTPYKDRIEAARSAQATHKAGSPEEIERQAKTAALKSFLMKSAQSGLPAVDNPFNAKPAPPPNDLENRNQGFKHRSNPNTPLRNGYDSGNNHQYFPPMPYMHSSMSPGPKPPGSNLRNIYSPELGRLPAELATTSDTQHARVSTARSELPAQQQQYHGYPTTPHRPNTQEQTAGLRSTPSAQQLEDDLRRVLKLDLTSQG